MGLDLVSPFSSTLLAPAECSPRQMDDQGSLRSVPNRGLLQNSASKSTRGAIPRLERHQRACYLCAEIAPDRFRPETLIHTVTLLLCDNGVYQRRRGRFVAAVRALHVASQRAPLRPDLPPAGLNFDDNSVLFTILQLCTGVGSNYGLMQRLPVAPQLVANSVDPRLSPQFTRDSDLARRTIEWYLPLLQDWMKILNDPRRPESPLDSPGCKLALLVARHVRDMFALRKSAEPETNTLKFRFTSGIEKELWTQGLIEHKRHLDLMFEVNE